METNRRGFLKIGGMCALGLGALPAVNALAKAEPKVSSNTGDLALKRWAMVVDMKKCWEKGKEGCKDCIAACHRVHNVPNIQDPSDEIKWIWTEHFQHAFPGQEHDYLAENMKDKPFIILCNHCTKPSCVRVCPTKATWKRKQDGIVMMDYHRCIGCRFCMAACPYGSRSFNFRDPQPYIEGELNMAFPRREKGVVEKCNFCEERLKDGLLPACVEACKCGAICFGDLEDGHSAVRKLLASHFTIRRKPDLGTGPNVYYIV